jgi:hypothetical protein
MTGLPFTMVLVMSSCVLEDFQPTFVLPSPFLTFQRLGKDERHKRFGA